MIQIENFMPYFYFLEFKLPPSFWWALGIITGIGAAYCHPALTIGVVVFFFLFKIPHKKALVIFTLLGGTAFFYHETTMYPPLELKDIYIKGKITDKSFSDSTFFKHRARIDVQRIKTENGWVHNSFCLYLYSKKRLYGRVQDIIECGPLNIKTPADKNFSFFLKREGVAGTSFVENIKCKIIKRPFFSPLNWIFWQRELLQIKIKKKLSPQTFSLFSSLFIGNRKPVNKNLSICKPLFKKWGILHHLARSGLHLVVFIMIWHYLLNMIPISFELKQLTISFLILFYFLFSWSSLSFLRAFFIYAFYKASTFAKSKLHPLHAICCACIAILLNNPFHLFFLDFQLSFLLSFFLLWITHIDHQRTLYSYQSLAEKKKKSLA